MKPNAFVILSLLACGCASHRQECCVGQGPDWVVATFGKEKAAEINAIGYSRWVDESAGSNTMNGLYKLVVDVGREVTNDTTIIVGDFTVLAKEPGEYSFLLEKGVRYNIAYRPFSSNIVARIADAVAVGDKDGDGLADEIDPNPEVSDGDCFGTGAAWYNSSCKGILTAKDTGASAPDIQWIFSSSSNEYFFVRFKVGSGPARVDFKFLRNKTLLDDLHVIARAHDVCIVPVPVGSVCIAKSSVDFELFEFCDQDREVPARIGCLRPRIREISPKAYHPRVILPPRRTSPRSKVPAQ